MPIMLKQMPYFHVLDIVQTKDKHDSGGYLLIELRKRSFLIKIKRCRCNRGGGLVGRERGMSDKHGQVTGSNPYIFIYSSKMSGTAAEVFFRFVDIILLPFVHCGLVFRMTNDEWRKRQEKGSGREKRFISII